MNNFAALGKAICPVCGVLHDSGEVLIHKRLKPINEKEAITGLKLCDEHQRLKDEGYVALVEIDREPRAGENPLTDVPRTGQIAHVRERAWPHLFNTPPPPHGVCVIEVGVISELQKATNGPDPESH